MPSFSELYELLTRKGPGKSVSSRGTNYRIEAKKATLLLLIPILCWPEG